MIGARTPPFWWVVWSCCFGGVWGGWGGVGFGGGGGGLAIGLRLRRQLVYSASYQLAEPFLSFAEGDTYIRIRAFGYIASQASLCPFAFNCLPQSETLRLAERSLVQRSQTYLGSCN